MVVDSGILLVARMAATTADYLADPSDCLWERRAVFVLVAMMGGWTADLMERWKVRWTGRSKGDEWVQ